MPRPVIDPSAATAPVGTRFRVAPDGRLVRDARPALWPDAFALTRRWAIERHQFTGPPSRIWVCESCGEPWRERPRQFGCCPRCDGAIEARWLYSRSERVPISCVAFRGGHCDVCNKPISFHRIVGEASKPIPTRCRKHQGITADEAHRAKAEAMARLQATDAKSKRRAAKAAAYDAKWLAGQFAELVGEPEPVRNGASAFPPR